MADKDVVVVRKTVLTAKDSDTTTHIFYVVWMFGYPEGRMWCNLWVLRI
jgi:hypothetical protein